MAPSTSFISAFPINRSSFLPSLTVNRSATTPLPNSRQCAAVRMRLISHEKLSVVFESDDGEIANYKLCVQIPGEFSKDQRGKSVREMRKKANFPGFRKGTIPPFILKDIDMFVLQASIEDLVEEAITELDLQHSEGEDDVAKYDFEAILKEFKVGEDIQFDCEMVLMSTNKEKVDVDSLPEIVSLPDGVEQPKKIDINDVKGSVIDVAPKEVPILDDKA